MPSKKETFQDSLYGHVQLDEPTSALTAMPIVQRLRHIRLSNIDSLDMPSIANISRYEHVLGVAYLAGCLGLRSRLSRFEDLVLKSSALLHDWAITAFGHLVEEALQYAGTAFDHQERLSEIASGDASDEILGVQMQILLGRQTGLVKWARKVMGSESKAEQLVHEITEHIRGKGQFGKIICGDIDLDNIDNVFRVAYHLGLPINREVPIRLARAIIGYHTGDSAPIFKREAEEDIEAWRSTRSRVYEHLMLAKRDFAGKAMIIYATVRAFQAGEIKLVDWSLTDFDFIHKLLCSNVKETRDTAERWIAGEPWEITTLNWMDGSRPEYKEILAFSNSLSDLIGRTCFAYGIKDKRDRELQVHFENDIKRRLGKTPKQWLLGIGSPGRAFTAAEISKIFDLARSFFQSRVVGPAYSDYKESRQIQPSLL